MAGGGPSAASSLYSGIFNRKPDAQAVDPDTKEQTARHDEAVDHSADAEKDGGRQNGGPAPTPSSPAPSSQSQGSAYALVNRKNLNANKNRRPVAAPASVLSAAFVGTLEGTPDSTGPHSSDGTSHAVVNSPAPSQTPTKPIAAHPIAVHGVQTKALTVAQHDSATLVANLPNVIEPPALFLAEEELERDRALFKARAAQRGELSVSAHTSSLSYRNEGRKDNERRWQDEGGDDDVNGFMNTAEGKKARKKNQRRRRNLSPGHHGGLAASLNMDADYDVRIPNDFNDFKELLRKRKDSMRRQKQLARNRDNADGVCALGEGSEEDSDDDDGREDPDAHRAKLPRFAPPKSYTEGRGDEVKMTPQFPPFPDTTAGQRLPPGPPPGPPPALPPSVPSQTLLNLTGEEAYQRRVAMSQLSHPVQPTPDEMSADLIARRAKAAAIASRLAQAAPLSGETHGQGEHLASAIDPSASFAERLMMKQGWKKGEALGADGNKGILDPILAQKADADRQKRADGDRQNARAVGGSSARGTIVNAQAEQKKEEERARYGESSEIILLENMVDNDDDIDDDLSDEIGEECSKYGYVDRVFIWPAGSSANAAIVSPRIFVRFTGMAGAWRCLKELDGRFFAGHTVRARYYPSHDFTNGHYDRL